MKNKFIPFLIGSAVGVSATVLYGERVIRKICNAISRDYVIYCPVLSSYGNTVSILLNNTRYDLFLEEEFDSSLSDTVVTAKMSDNDILDITAVESDGRDIEVSCYRMNKKQIERLTILPCFDVDDSGLSIRYYGKGYRLLLDCEQVSEKVKGNTVRVLLADGKDEFDILRVEGFEVITWEEIPSEEEGMEVDE